MKLDDLIDVDTYKEKLSELNDKIEQSENEYQKYQKLSENDRLVVERLARFKECLSLEEPLQSFDAAVWQSIIDECIIGGKDESGMVNPYTITFVFKTGDISMMNAVKKRRVIHGRKNGSQNVSHPDNNDM